jgi:hypothetical protein
LWGEIRVLFHFNDMILAKDDGVPRARVLIERIGYQLMDFVRFLQSGEANIVEGITVMSQESTNTCGMYLSFMIECQIPICVKTCQRVSAANAWLVLERFLIPQPPLFFVFSNVSQLHRCWRL